MAMWPTLDHQDNLKEEALCRLEYNDWNCCNDWLTVVVAGCLHEGYLESAACFAGRHHAPSSMHTCVLRKHARNLWLVTMHVTVSGNVNKDAS